MANSHQLVIGPAPWSKINFIKSQEFLGVIKFPETVINYGFWKSW